MFPSASGRIQNHANIIKGGLIPPQIAAGVVTDEGKAKYTGLHSLRHFFASWLINSVDKGGLGLPPKEVQERLGHSSIQMTLDVYAHMFGSDHDGDALAAAQDRLLGIHAT